MPDDPEKIIARAYWAASLHFGSMPVEGLGPGPWRRVYTADEMGQAAVTARRLARLAIHHKLLSMGKGASDA